MGFNIRCKDLNCTRRCCNYYGRCPTTSVSKKSSSCWHNYNQPNQGIASVGALAGAIVGSIFGFLILLFAIIFVVKKIRASSQPPEDHVMSTNQFNISTQNLDAKPTSDFQNIYGPAYNGTTFGKPAYGQPTYV